MKNRSSNMPDMSAPTYYPPYVWANMKRFMNPDLSDLLAWIIMEVDDEWIRGDGSDENRNFWADRVEEARSKLL